MDSFEQVVSEILWDEGLWVWRSFKVAQGRCSDFKIGLS
jgi:hypothetical protein